VFKREVFRFKCIGSLRTMRVVSPIVYFLNLVVARNTLNLYLLNVFCICILVRIVEVFILNFIYDHFRTTHFEN
jgi:hypothetical protein